MNQILIQELFQTIAMDEENDWLVSVPCHEEIFWGSKMSKMLGRLHDQMDLIDNFIRKHGSQ